LKVVQSDSDGSGAYRRCHQILIKHCELTMTLKTPLSFMLASFVLFMATTGHSRQGVMDVVGAPKPTTMLTDKPIAAFQSELLDLAFETATVIPVKPHIKDRSRAQESVVGASLKLDQPQKALEFIGKIDDWRRGSGYGDLAFYSVLHGQSDVEHYLNLAKQISEVAEDWRKDAIKVKIAKTHALLGHSDKVEELEAGIVESESGKVAGIKAMTATKDSFKDQMKALDVLIKTENFDIIKNALESGTELFNRFYENKKQRSQVEKKIKSSWDKMPYFIRIDLLESLAGFALDHKDQTRALELVNEAQVIIDANEWPLENRIPMIAKLAKLRFQAGDQQKARSDVDNVLAFFNTEGNTIVDIYRVGAILPLAEAYQSMGDKAVALNVYKRAVEESVVNPNSRPRAEDMTAILSSMATNGVEPDDELWARIRDIKKSLGNPW
jgi:tetratricopeptide (TPR) repeat protein